jgi:hypothetical protein
MAQFLLSSISWFGESSSTDIIHMLKIQVSPIFEPTPPSAWLFLSRHFWLPSLELAPFPFSDSLALCQACWACYCFEIDQMTVPWNLDMKRQLDLQKEESTFTESMQ